MSIHVKEENIQKLEAALVNIYKHGWQVVDLRNCGLKEIPKELFNCPGLITIDLGNDEFADEIFRNSIKVIPDDISKISNLVNLNLENNKVEIISDKISELRKLKYLNLNNNKLRDLSEKITNLPTLKELNISNNPFDMLPPEIVERGISSIQNFFKELKEQDFIYEAKLIIVGEGRVGKTCLSKALLDDDYCLEHETSTEGININRWVIPKEEMQEIDPKFTRDFQVNIWDFGGQEIYHSTHQFFLTKRSMYLLITESRKEDSHDDFFYWLNIIQLLGDKSPVVMVMNKCDQPTKELPIKEYKATFSNVDSFEKISLVRENGFRDKFMKFKYNLKKILSGLPHIGNPLPKVWVDIRRDIEKLKLSGLNYISQERYFEICKKHYRKEDSALFLSEYFHDLGVIMHFQDDVELRDLVILNHEWITRGVYKVLDDRKVLEQKGKFYTDDIIRIWSDDEHKNKIRELISLMKNTKFDLCFELNNGEFLVPRLLPVDEVEHVWENNPENAKFEFRYKFMPKGILARLIVKLNSDIYDDKYWRYGVILQYDGSRAIIKEKYFENKIIIELQGDNKREFLFLIRKALHEIHKDFNKINVVEMVPCNCSFCSSSGVPHFYDYNVLRRYESSQISNIRCDVSLQEVKVFNLTSDISSKALSEHKIVVCENQNASLLSSVGLDKIDFFPERDSSSVFMKVKTRPDVYGLRDRDFLLDSEIVSIIKKYKNYVILDYYCFENYLYHPDNLEELELKGFSKSGYTKEIIKQKNERKNTIISVYKNSRKSYQEFKIEEEKLINKPYEHEIIDYLESNDIETFFKAFSMKDHFKKDTISKYQLKQTELADTNWFKRKITRMFESIK